MMLCIHFGSLKGNGRKETPLPSKSKIYRFIPLYQTYYCSSFEENVNVLQVRKLKQRCKISPHVATSVRYSLNLTKTLVFVMTVNLNVLKEYRAV